MAHTVDDRTDAKLYKQSGDLTKNLAVNAIDSAKAKTVLTNLKTNGQALSKAAEHYQTKIKGRVAPAEGALREGLGRYKHAAETDINAYTNALQ